MSDRAMQPHPKDNEMFGKYLPVKQSAWLGHWMQPKHSRDNLLLENKQWSEPSELKVVSGGIKERAESLSVEAGSKGMNDGSHLKEDRSELLSFPTFHKNGSSNRKQVPRMQTGQCNEFKAAITCTIKPQSAYAFGHQLQEMRNAATECKLLPKETTPNLELELRAHDSVEGGCNPDTKSSQGKLLGVPSSYPYEIMYKKQNIIPFASTSKEHLTQRSYHDFNIDTVRLTSTLDAQNNTNLGPPLYAQRTRHFLITEKMAIGVSDEGKIFRESMLSTKFNGNMGGFLSLSSASGEVRPGLKLQLLDGSTDSEQIGRGSEENQKDEGSRSIGRLNTVGALTDETSAETRTMEVEVSLENNHTNGGAVSRLNKAAPRGQSAVSSSQGKSANTGLPDMNEVAQAPDGSANKVGPSTSKTQSLDMECLFSNNDCPSTSKSVPSHAVQPRAELGSRWVKRLKLSSSYTKYAAVGTKSSTLEEASSYEKLRKLSSNLFNRSIGPTNLQSTYDTHIRHTSERNKKVVEDRNQSDGVKGSTISFKEDRNSLLSHSWIRRWRHDQTAFPKKLLIPSEPSENPKAGYDHFEKKTFPSIAAMALMGKAMNGFRPCEFTKKGTFIVWNTNTLPRD